VKKDFYLCLKQIEEQLRATNGQSEYALYIKALILRRNGHVQESLTTFQAALCLNPLNPANLKQVGQSLHLLGKHKQAIDLFEEAEQMAPDDRDIYHNKGICYMYLRNHEKAISCFETANSIQRHEATFTQLGTVYERMGKTRDALGTYMDALEIAAENPDVLCKIGLLYLNLGDTTKAFEYLGNSLTYDNTNATAILAAGSIVQNNQDVDVALSKYRLAVGENPNSAELWNNVGMCFFSKGSKVMAAVSCLRRAVYLAPFEWIINYNLGVVYLVLGQAASAFHYFSVSINLNAAHAKSYSYLAVSLAKLDDFDNACNAYRKALEVEPDDHTTRLNYAVTLYRNNEAHDAARELSLADELLHAVETRGDDIDPDLPAMASALRDALHDLQ
jgi:Bardet-Biedl syndrome 4 protein